MKSTRLCLGLMAVGLSLASLTQSCVSDMPFGYGYGEGTLRMQLVVNSDITRADLDESELTSKSIVYISGQKGLLYQYEGLDNVPDAIRLKTGHYTAEAWTGDSVTASFDKRFFRGYKGFDIEDSNNTSVVLICKIANVVVSINHETVQTELMKDWKITVSNSRGSLEFDETNMEDAKGYFMMPNSDIAVDENGEYIKDEDGWVRYTNLRYKIEGTNAEGKAFVKEGPIASPSLKGGNFVERAHEYRLNLVYNPKYEETGGSFVTIVVSDEEVLVKEEVGLFSRPVIKGATFDIDKQLQGAQGQFADNLIKVTAFNGIKSVLFSSPDYDKFGIDVNGTDLIEAVDYVKSELQAKGIKWDIKSNEEKGLETSYITFSKDFLNTLPERDEEYRLDIKVQDGYGKENTAVFRIAVGEAAKMEEDPMVLDAVSSFDKLALRATYATVSGTLTSQAQNPKIQYRKSGSMESWRSVDVPFTRGNKAFSVKLTGLTPNTGYEYQAVDGEFKSTVQYFNTEDKFVIPNANMEDWSTYGNSVVFPGSGSNATFWDTGNQGAKMGGATLTDKSTTMFHSQSFAAKLETKKVLSLVIAAGNMFSGKFGKTSGTSGAELTFGRDFNGSHPDAMKVWANYRPAKVNSSQSHANLPKGELDHGQVYVAFITEPITFNTANKEYFEADNPSWKHYNKVVGYGEITWKGENFGPDNGLAELTIPITWRENAKSLKPTQIVIVCSASKYGDYFVGGQGSVMYLDDFELVYE